MDYKDKDGFEYDYTDTFRILNEDIINRPVSDDKQEGS